ncbi:MAG: hypothetical protein ACJ0DJ_02660 [bacterium]
MKQKINNTIFSVETRGNASQISKISLFALMSQYFEFDGISNLDIFCTQIVTVDTFFFELSQLSFFTGAEG